MTPLAWRRVRLAGAVPRQQCDRLGGAGRGKDIAIRARSGRPGREYPRSRWPVKVSLEGGASQHL